MKSYFLFFLFAIIGHNSFSNELKNIDLLVDFTPSTKASLSEMDLSLLGIVNNPSSPEAILNFENKIFILSIGEQINKLTLTEIGNARITLQLPDKKLIDLYLGEGLVNFKLDQTTITAKDNNTPKTSVDRNLPEYNQANKSVNQFIEQQNISTFETKVLQALTQQPGLSNAGRVGWVMPENILGHAIEKLHFEPGDLILNVNGIPAERVRAIYEMYKDNSIKYFSIEVKRGDTLFMLDIVRP